MSRYRVVEQINNALGGNNKKYIIEKHKRFLFWTWWSRDYLFDAVYCCFESYDKADMENMYEILIGNKKWAERTVIRSN